MRALLDAGRKGRDTRKKREDDTSFWWRVPLQFCQLCADTDHTRCSDQPQPAAKWIGFGKRSKKASASRQDSNPGLARRYQLNLKRAQATHFWQGLHHLSAQWSGQSW